MTTNFDAEKHIRNFATLDWEQMFDEEGNLLLGIRGKTGATEVGQYGEEIGADLIEMQPGTAFPLHTHPGDHILYAISGRGTVTIDGSPRQFAAGFTFYIAGSYPHNVGTIPGDTEPFTILAIGHPKKHVSATDRMHVVETENHQ